VEKGKEEFIHFTNKLVGK